MVKSLYTKGDLVQHYLFRSFGIVVDSRRTASLRLEYREYKVFWLNPSPVLKEQTQLRWIDRSAIELVEIENGPTRGEE
jgi:hypothetical protein